MNTTLTNTELSQWIDTNMTRLGQSAVQINDGMVVYIDVFKEMEGLAQADYFFVTHDHSDHFNPKIIRSLCGEGTQVIVPEIMRRRGKDQGLSTTGLKPGETKAVKDMTVMAIPAYNLTKPMHPRNREHVGYLITLPSGIRIYHAGDTDFIPEMHNLKPDIALIPVGGMATMNWKSALLAKDAIGARVTIPIHYGIIPFSAAGAKRFLVHGGDSVKELHSKTY